ncbi:type VI immunity family protein [Paracoccus xiamenensis]|uniref:type VI immunity family protein n=1 Tax=Paracoccus xiamenensis TaxID=2714901 RepID=UPI0014074A09|nr:type VI immunity family protein [Paracoccus xiamenensis]NHF74541.1 DUF3396 domain-containing protein [Paracoccus xiamenensis]
MDQKTDYERLDGLIIKDGNSGTPILRVGVQAQLFVRNGFDSAARAASVEALAAYARLAGDKVTRLLPSGAKRMQAIGGADFPHRQREDAAKSAPDDVFGITITDDEAPPRWRATAQMIGNYAPDWPSYFYTAVPPSFMKSDPDRYVRAVVEWASLLRPDYGTAGFALVLEAGMEFQYPKETWPFHARFSGLDMLGAFNFKIGPGKIQTVNWLTVLSDKVLAEIGGRAELTERLKEAWSIHFGAAPGDSLPPEFSLHDYDGGTVLRAGQYPQMGDVNIGGPPETYLVANDALRSVRFMKYEQRPGDLIRVPAPLDRYETTLEWITRFDARS